MILVTGASGTVGSAVSAALKAKGVRFKAGYHSRPEAVAGSGGDPVRVDYETPETLRAALDGVETVFLVSRTVAPEAQVVKAARQSGVKRIVKLSVRGADEEKYSFARWHRPVEREIEASGLAWTFLRPTGFMQNVVNYMAPTIKAQGAFYTTAPEALISHVDVRDIGAVAAQVLTEPGHEKKAYTLTGPEALSYGQIAETLGRVLGRTIRCVAIGDADLKKGAVDAGTPEAYAEALVDLNRFYREGGSSTVSPDVKAVTGRDPIAFERFARDHADAFA